MQSRDALEYHPLATHFPPLDGLADLPRTHSRDRAAAVVGVASRLVGLAAQILDRGMPELIAAVVHDAIKVSTAAVVATLDNAELDELLGKGPKAFVRGLLSSAGTRKTTSIMGLSRRMRRAPRGPLRCRLARSATIRSCGNCWRASRFGISSPSGLPSGVKHPSDGVKPMRDPIRREFPELDRGDTLRDDGPLGFQLGSHLIRLRHPRRWELCFLYWGTNHGNRRQYS